jgi:hypothetical protein
VHSFRYPTYSYPNDSFELGTSAESNRRDTKRRGGLEPPMPKLPNISLGYSCLRNSVCNICASATHLKTRPVRTNRETVRTCELFACSVSDDAHSYVNGARWLDDVTIYANATVLLDLFLLAVRQSRYTRSSPNIRPSNGCDKITLDGTLSHVSAESASRSIVVLVAWMGSDGFTVGRDGRGLTGLDLKGEPVFQEGALHVEPGNCLIVWGGEAVGVGGFIDGRPVLLVTNPGRPLIERGILHDAVMAEVFEDRGLSQPRPA